MKNMMGFFLILFLLFLSFGFPVFSVPEKPIMAVLDLEHPAISSDDSRFLVDLLTINFHETGRFRLVSRMERDRLLASHDFRLSSDSSGDYFREIGSLLFADYLSGGRITRENGRFMVRLFIYRLSPGHIVAEEVREFSDIDGIAGSLREWAASLAAAVPESPYPVKDLSAKVVDSLGPVYIREKVLFLGYGAGLTPEQAACREALYRAMAVLADRPDLFVYYAESDYDEAEPPLHIFNGLRKSMDCTSYGFIKREGDRRFFILCDGENAEKARVGTGIPIDPAAFGDEIVQTVSSLPLLPQEMLAGEIRENLSIERKIEDLLRVESVLSHNFSFRYHSRVLKSVFAPSLHPELNLLSFEGDLYYYYLTTIGLGIGYGFSVGYPGTIDVTMSGHPPIFQHEFRLTPLSFRSGDPVGIIVNTFVSLNFHNVSRIITHTIPPNTYEDAGYTFFLSTGIDIGFLFYLTENTSLYIDFCTLKYTFPIIAHPQFDGQRYFSGDLGGLGISFQFE
ncbi:MAG: hypothetical protein JW969_08140 [Spirochaetales bacterium]|nr:hypothetical protein [Spirochaetales bacterium]